MNRIFAILTAATLLLFNGCCTDLISIDPSLSMKPGATGGKPEWVGGAKIKFSLTECASEVFLVAWDALKKEKAELNDQLKRGEITKEAYDASIAKIDEERKLVLEKLGAGGTKHPSDATSVVPRDVLETRVASHILQTIAELKAMKSGGGAFPDK